jgi:hypothetical protein
MSNEFMPQDIERLKKQINDDLDVVVKRFNEDYAAWGKRTGCTAIMRWTYGHDGNRQLAKADVSFPVYRTEAGEEEIQSAEHILSKASPIII